MRRVVHIGLISSGLAIASAFGSGCQDPTLGSGAGGWYVQRTGGVQEAVELPNEYDGIGNPYSQSNDAASHGAALFQVNCAGCHGVQGNGEGGPQAAGLNPAPPSLRYAGSDASDAYLFWRIREGGAAFNTGMPAFEASDVDIWSLVTYIRVIAGVGPPAEGAYDDPTVGSGGPTVTPTAPDAGTTPPVDAGTPPADAATPPPTTPPPTTNPPPQQTTSCADLYDTFNNAATNCYYTGDPYSCAEYEYYQQTFPCDTCPTYCETVF